MLFLWQHLSLSDGCFICYLSPLEWNLPRQGPFSAGRQCTPLPAHACHTGGSQSSSMGNQSSSRSPPVRPLWQRPLWELSGQSPACSPHPKLWPCRAASSQAAFSSLYKDTLSLLRQILNLMGPQEPAWMMWMMAVLSVTEQAITLLKILWPSTSVSCPFFLSLPRDEICGEGRISDPLP